MSGPAATVIVVEHRDVFAWFGLRYLAGRGERVVVLDDAETADDLVRDVAEVVTSLCAGRYGRRAGKAVVVAAGAGSM